MNDTSAQRTIEGLILSKQIKSSARYKNQGSSFDGRGEYISLWLKTPDGSAVEVTTPVQQHVMFVHSESIERVTELLIHHGLWSKGKVEIKPLSLKTFEQKPVHGLYVDTRANFWQVKQLLEMADIEMFEADISLADRFLMERFIYGSARVVGLEHKEREHSAGIGKSPPCVHLQTIEPIELRSLEGGERLEIRAASLDIETRLDESIISVGISMLNQRKVIIVECEGNRNKETERLDWVEWVTSEAELLQQLATAIQEWDPDAIIGWNVINFDLRVLFQRAKALNITLPLGRRGEALSLRQHPLDNYQYFADIDGRAIIDGIDALKNATYQFESFTLESVAQELLGEGKDIEDVANRVAQIEKDFLNDPTKLARYNIIDCELVERIFEHTKILDYLALRSELTGLALGRMGGSVAAFVNVYLPKLHRAGYVSPNRPNDGGLASPGGYVMQASPGLYKNVIVLDFKSLYPSIIRTFLIDPLGLTEGLKSPEAAVPGFKDAVFHREKHFLPDIISKLWSERDKAKADKDKARSQAIKILMNSFYGVLGSGGCPFYDTRLASSITLRGHEIMQMTARFIEEKGHKVIYGDTDSTFVWIQNDKGAELDLAEIQKIGKTLANDINRYWLHKIQKEYRLQSYLEIEFETHFSRCFMPTIRGSEKGSKKRYAGRVETSSGHEIIIKGLETVRSDWTELARQFQNALLERVFADEPIEDIIQSWVDDTRAGLNDHLLVYRKRIRRALEDYTTNTPPHIKAARLLKERRLHFASTEQERVYINRIRPSHIRYVITHQGPEPVEFQQAKLNYEHYVEKQLKPIADALLPLLGGDFESVTSTQLNLFPNGLNN